MNILRRLKRNQNRAKRDEAIALLQKLPKPPKDERGQCACGCSHKHDHGPCPQFIAGGPRCAVCDHGLTCHRRKGEAPPDDWNVPLKLNDKHLSLYPARVNRIIRQSVSCSECGQPVAYLEQMQALLADGKTIKSGLCRECFDTISATDLQPGITVHDVQALRDQPYHPQLDGPAEPIGLAMPPEGDK
jgi:DNA-directed RNA polymerase subunit M/transcription elongation factor TFIIS